MTKYILHDMECNEATQFDTLQLAIEEIKSRLEECDNTNQREMRYSELELYEVRERVNFTFTESVTVQLR